jgi:hypothetical protein
MLAVAVGNMSQYVATNLLSIGSPWRFLLPPRCTAPHRAKDPFFGQAELNLSAGRRIGGRLTDLSPVPKPSRSPAAQPPIHQAAGGRLDHITSSPPSSCSPRPEINAQAAGLTARCVALVQLSRTNSNAQIVLSKFLRKLGIGWSRTSSAHELPSSPSLRPSHIPSVQHKTKPECQNHDQKNRLDAHVWPL